MKQQGGTAEQFPFATENCRSEEVKNRRRCPDRYFQFDMVR